MTLLLAVLWLGVASAQVTWGAVRTAYFDPNGAGGAPQTRIWGQEFTGYGIDLATGQVSERDGDVEFYNLNTVLGASGGFMVAAPGLQRLAGEGLEEPSVEPTSGYESSVAAAVGDVLLVVRRDGSLAKLRVDRVLPTRIFYSYVLESGRVDPTTAGTAGRQLQPAAQQAWGSASGSMGALTVGERVSGSMAAATEDELVYHTYAVGVPAGLESLTVRLSGAGDDLDLAAKFGAEITSYDEVDFLDVSTEPNPSHTWWRPAAGVLYVDVLNLLEQPVAYELEVAGEARAEAAGDTRAEAAGEGGAPPKVAPAGSVSLVGNTWVFQTMAYPSASGGMTNEFIGGHLSLYPAGGYEMVTRIGDFTNRYAGTYTAEGDQLALSGYGVVRFEQSGVRLSLRDGAGSIYGLALEGTCEGGVCATR